MAELNWHDYAPRGVQDPNGPNGEPITTPTDRRWLWHVEDVLAVSATNDTQRDLRKALSAYLHETCDHHWHERLACSDQAKDCAPPYRQCLWCNAVEWLIDGEWCLDLPEAMRHG